MKEKLEKILHQQPLNEAVKDPRIDDLYTDLKNSTWSNLELKDVALALAIGALHQRETSILKVAIQYLIRHNHQREFVHVYLDILSQQMKRAFLHNALLIIGLLALVYITFRTQLSGYHLLIFIGVGVVLNILNFIFITYRHSIGYLNKKEINTVKSISKLFEGEARNEEV